MTSEVDLDTARAAVSERIRFTPPRFRGSAPPPAMPPLVVLQGRRHGSRDDAEWSTWETSADDRPDSSNRLDAEMTRREAALLIEEFSSRAPHHEFRIVLARPAITQERLA